jgi:hypothetical protein
VVKIGVSSSKKRGCMSSKCGMPIAPASSIGITTHQMSGCGAR